MDVDKFSIDDAISLSKITVHSLIYLMKKFIFKILLFPVALTTWIGYTIIGLVIFENWGEYTDEVVSFWGWYFL